MKKTIPLYKATELKDELERAITEDNKLILKLCKENKLHDAEDIQLLKAEKSQLLIYLTASIAEQNVKDIKGEKLSNSYYIKHRSELTREKTFQQELNNLTNYRDNLEKVKIIKEFDTDIKTVSNKLSEFNKSHKIKVEISDNLLATLTTFLGE